MQFASLKECLLHTINRVGYISSEQIMMFCRGLGDPNVKIALRDLASHSYIQYDPKKGIYLSKIRPTLTEPAIQLLLRAAWVPANFGIKNIRDIWTTDYPSQLIFITEDDAIYDVTVYSISDAPAITLLANRLWKAKTPEGQEDIVNHVAVVPLRKMAAELQNAGFDYICTIEADGTAQYFEY